MIYLETFVRENCFISLQIFLTNLEGGSFIV